MPPKQAEHLQRPRPRRRTAPRTGAAARSGPERTARTAVRHVHRLGGVLVPFIGIKLIDLVVSLLPGF